MAENDSRVVGNKFLPLHQLYKRPDYNYSKIKLDNSFLEQNFAKISITHLDHNLEDAGYFFHVSIKFSKSLSWSMYVMMFMISLSRFIFQPTMVWNDTGFN